MIDKEKWKTHPCKECLLKKVCIKLCFEIPEDKIDQVSQLYKDSYKNNKICIACGGNKSSKHECDECNRLDLMMFLEAMEVKVNLIQLNQSSLKNNHYSLDRIIKGVC